MTTQPIRIPHQGLGDEMLTIEEVSDLIRVPINTLRYWRHLGSGPRSFRLGRHIRYWKTDVVLWVTDQASRPQHGA